MGDVIVIGVLAVVVALVIRSMWKAKKNGSGCCGCSGNCGGCSGACSRMTDTKRNR